jgi:hypothetical protein
LTGNAGRALISDQSINNRQVASAGQAALIAVRQNKERRFASLHPDLSFPKTARWAR